MNNVAVKQDMSNPVVSDTAAIIQVIERAAGNPDVDIDKMERLLEMQERIMNRNAKNAFAAAFSDMQNDIPVITERGEIKIRNEVQSRYAKWEDINTVIKPILQKHGFGLSFKTGRTPNMLIVTGILTHREGHSEESTIELPADNSGSKNAVQAVGSSTSYGKRYVASALLNITTGGEDDGGVKAGAPATISEDQLKRIRALISETGADIEKLCKYYNIDAVPDLPSEKFETVVNRLNAKKKGAGNA